MTDKPHVMASSPSGRGENWRFLSLKKNEGLPDINRKGSYMIAKRC